MIKRIINSLESSLQGKESLPASYGWGVFLWLITTLIDLGITCLNQEYFANPPSLIAENIIFSVDLFLTITIRLFIVIIVWNGASNAKYNIWRYCTKTLVVLFTLLTAYGFSTNVSYIVGKNHLLAVSQPKTFNSPNLQQR